MLTIDRDAGADALLELQAALHPDDAAELRAAGVGLEVLQAVPRDALRWDGALVAVFGVSGTPHECGIPWMLCTTVLDRVPRRAMAAVSRQVVDDWRGQWAFLTNMVHRRNERAVRFVRWLGFHVDPRPCGPDDEFLLFEWRRDV